MSQDVLARLGARRRRSTASSTTATRRSGPARNEKDVTVADARRHGQLGQPACIQLARGPVERGGLRPAAKRGRLPAPGSAHRLARRSRASTSAAALPRRVDASTRTRRPATAGDAALYSGRGTTATRRSSADHGADAANAELTFDALWDQELGWDFGFAQISTDGGATYTSPPVHRHDLRPRSGRTSDRSRKSRASRASRRQACRPQVCSLAGYAGQTVLSRSAAFNDPATLGADGRLAQPGFWVDDVKVGADAPLRRLRRSTGVEVDSRKSSPTRCRTSTSDDASASTRRRNGRSRCGSSS